jgi:hypothetical protein
MKTTFRLGTHFTQTNLVPSTHNNVTTATLLLIGKVKYFCQPYNFHNNPNNFHNNTHITTVDITGI